MESWDTEGVYRSLSWNKASDEKKWVGIVAVGPTPRTHATWIEVKAGEEGSSCSVYKCLPCLP